MSENFEYTGDDVLEIMSKYAVNRNNYIEKLIIKSFGLNSLLSKKKILEFGAGKGEFINRLKDNDNLDRYAVELDDTYLKDLSLHHKAYSSLDAITEQLDFIYLIDVLEHLENDSDFLKRFYDKLVPGGKLLIYVPARMELFSQFDKNIGHFRRYTKTELTNKLKAAGFFIQTIRYHEILGYVASFANKVTSKDGRLKAGSVKIYDQLLVPATNLIEKIINPPIGKSLYSIAIKK